MRYKLNKMKKKLNKLIKKGLITEVELNNFINTLVKLSTLKIVPSKPKKVIEKLVHKSYNLKKNKIKPTVVKLSETDMSENVDD